MGLQIGPVGSFTSEGETLNNLARELSHNGDAEGPGVRRVADKDRTKVCKPWMGASALS